MTAFLSLFFWLWQKKMTLLLLILPTKARIYRLVFPTGDTAVSQHNANPVWIAQDIRDVVYNSELWNQVWKSSVCVCVLTLRRIFPVLQGEQSSRRGGSRPSTPQLCDVCSCKHTQTHANIGIRPWHTAVFALCCYFEIQVNTLTPRRQTSEPSWFSWSG